MENFYSNSSNNNPNNQSVNSRFSNTNLGLYEKNSEVQKKERPIIKIIFYTILTMLFIFAILFIFMYYRGEQIIESLT